MTELERFEELKKKVLLKYQEYYPFFQGNWKSFSSQDIQNLIGLIEQHCKQTISEKWVYTHLKPEISTKVPRKDMLTILCQFVGVSGWDEFIFEDTIENDQKFVKPKRWKSRYLLGAMLLFVLVGFYFMNYYPEPKDQTNPIEIKNEFTKENVNPKDIEVFQIEDSISKKVKIENGKVLLQNTSKPSKLVIRSPFYRSRTVDLKPNNTGNPQLQTIDLQPNDYAMVLKAFMVSDIKDWKTRKEQLNKILSDDLEVIVMLKGDLGSEYFNKKEFSQKLIVPAASLKKMKLVEIKNDLKNQINFIRIKQE